MDNADLPGKLTPLSGTPFDDIPEAVRETVDPEPQGQSQRLIWLGGGLGLGAIALGLGIWFMTQSQSRPTPDLTANPAPVNSQVTEPAPTNSGATATTPATNLLGHLPYEEAPVEELRPITPDGRIQLRAAAARAFNEMVAAARADGIDLVPISGFRSLNDQEYLFFDVKAERGQAATKRAEVSAPPGYSEHHTGYAVDIGDGNVPATNLSPAFGNTAAFAWLRDNAAHFSFEISFPEGNPQGVSYEPWHWRFVGDRHSLETFYKARELQNPASGQ